MNLRNNLSEKMMYKSFIPSLIENYQYSVNSSKLDKLTALFCELNTMLTALCEDKRFQLIRMEANDSWRLADNSPMNPFAFSLDNENAENIVKATVYAEEALDELPVSTRLIRNIHYLICAGSDYDKKYRGEYRISPVWIGEPGKGLYDASFIPPVDEDLISAITDLENYINYSEDNVFVKAAIFHYQFEMIHPFIDGNGRTGRLLNNIFLTENGVLSFPILLLSHIIARDYNHYCTEIQRVNETGDISAWLTYWFDIMRKSVTYTIQVIKNSL